MTRRSIHEEREVEEDVHLINLNWQIPGARRGIVFHAIVSNDFLNSSLIS